MLGARAIERRQTLMPQFRWQHGDFRSESRRRRYRKGCRRRAQPERAKALRGSHWRKNAKWFAKSNVAIPAVRARVRSVDVELAIPAKSTQGLACC